MRTHRARASEDIDAAESHPATSTVRPDGRSIDLQSDAVRASTEQAGGALRQQIDEMLRRGAPDVDRLIEALEGCSDAQRQALAADQGLIDRLVQVCPIERLPRVLRAVIDDPKWALYHYACRRGGRDPKAARGLIAGATVEQQLEIVRWAELVGRLREICGDAHPDALFGAALSARIDAELAAGQGSRIAQSFLEWRWRAMMLDPGAMLADMARSPAALAAGLAGDPSAFDRWLAETPRAAALDGEARARLDHIALAGGLSADRLRQAFTVRFGLPLERAGLDASQIQAVWRRLAPLPVGRIDRRLVRQACLDPAGGDAGWMAAEVDEAPRQAAGAVDTPREEAHEEGSSEPSGAVERAEAEQAAVLDVFVEACGGDAALRAAAEGFLTGALADADWQQAVLEAEARGVLAVPASEVEAALRRLRDGDRPRLAISGPAAAPTARPARASGRGLPGWLGGLSKTAPGGSGGRSAS